VHFFALIQQQFLMGLNGGAYYVDAHEFVDVPKETGIARGVAGRRVIEQDLSLCTGDVVES
jgi:hypothetical protein